MPAGPPVIHQTDVLVVGGGPAGAAAALDLARAGRHVVLADRARVRESRVGETLPPVASAILAELGVWEDFRAQRHLPCDGIRSAWGAPDLYEQSHAFNPYGPGWHLDRSAFDQLLVLAAERAGVIVRRDVEGAGVLRGEGGGWLVPLGSDRRHGLRASFVIDATGRAAAFARRQGTPRRILDRLVGVVRYVEANRRSGLPEPYVLVQATEHGWWYSAPVPEHALAVVYMTDADLLARDRSLLGERWWARLAAAPHTWRRVCGASPGPGPWVVAASTSRLESPVGPGWLAIGDAAASFDPLSSQGLSRALETGLLGSRAADRHLAGCRSALADYAGQIDDNFQGYLALRTEYYSRERRWPASPFWRRRMTVLRG